MNVEFDYLTKRASLFIEILDKQKIANIFPEREATKNHLKEIIKSESLRKIKILNDVIDNIIIGNNGLKTEEKYNIISFFYKELGEDERSLINKKLNLYQNIKKENFIKSRNVINDAIEIANSDILGLSEMEKMELSDIIQLSMQARI